MMRRSTRVTLIAGAVFLTKMAGSFVLATPAKPLKLANPLAIELVSLGKLTVKTGKTVFMPGTAAGTRLVIDFAEVAIDGPRLQAKKAAVAGGDWLTIGPDNVATLDIRILVETQDGASILIHGLGRTDSAKFTSGAPCYFTPLFETSDSRYAWLNKIQAVAKGQSQGDTVVFELYEVR